MLEGQKERRKLALSAMALSLGETLKNYDSTPAAPQGQSFLKPTSPAIFLSTKAA